MMNYGMSQILKMSEFFLLRRTEFQTGDIRICTALRQKRAADVTKAVEGLA